MASPFFTLQSLPVPERIVNGLSLDTLVLEKEMQQYNGGIDLATLPMSHREGDDQFLKQFVPQFAIGEGSRNEEKVRTMTKKYLTITAPCSMVISNTEELWEHMLRAYQIAHFHYILGRKYLLKGTFPHNCCGLSSNNVMLSLQQWGYTNTSRASTAYDHGYDIMPFVLPEQKLEGVIVIDPTYNQLWSKTDTRNAVFVKLGIPYQYTTEWAKGANLFPRLICSLDVVRKTPHELWNIDYYHTAGLYFQTVFSNPITLEI